MTEDLTKYWTDGKTIDKKKTKVVKLGKLMKDNISAEGIIRSGDLLLEIKKVPLIPAHKWMKNDRRRFGVGEKIAYIGWETRFKAFDYEEIFKYDVMLIVSIRSDQTRVGILEFFTTVDTLVREIWGGDIGKVKNIAIVRRYWGDEKLEGTNITIKVIKLKTRRKI